MADKLKAILSWLFGWFFKASLIIKILVILVVLVAAFLIGRQIIVSKNQGYIFGKVERQTISEIVTESGTVTSNGRVDIYSPTNGVVQKVYVGNGAQIKEYQKLFSVKSTATQTERANALADLRAAEVVLKQAENTWRGTGVTVERVLDEVKNHSTDETFLQKETRTAAQVANDNAYDSLRAAQAALTSAQMSYQATQNSTVTAPIGGFISNLSVASGSGVLAYSVLSPTTPVLAITGLGPSEIVITVSEGDINKIKVGQKADIKLDAIPDKTFKGLVARYDETGNITAGVVKFNVYIVITDPDSRIKAGMSADVDITTNVLADVLSVPNTAIKPYQKGRAVRVLDKAGKVEFIPVKVGLKGKENTQIFDGPAEGTEIIISLPSEKVSRPGLFSM